MYQYKKFGLLGGDPPTLVPNLQSLKITRFIQNLDQNDLLLK